MGLVKIMARPIFLATLSTRVQIQKPKLLTPF